jgi:hypothetical protein
VTKPGDIQSFSTVALADCGLFLADTLAKILNRAKYNKHY